MLHHRYNVRRLLNQYCGVGYIDGIKLNDLKVQSLIATGTCQYTESRSGAVEFLHSDLDDSASQETCQVRLGRIATILFDIFKLFPGFLLLYTSNESGGWRCSVENKGCNIRAGQNTSTRIVMICSHRQDRQWASLLH